MDKLELKIPPPAQALIVGLGMWLVSRTSPGFALSGPIKIAACAVLCAGGASFVLSGVLSFRKAATTVNPFTPQSSTALVTGGVYRFTRNPMYVGMMLFLLAWGVFLANAFSLATSVAFVLGMNRFQIRPEERALTALFGDEYLAYVKRVRRWL